ncbi:site-specific tyrosine recombinase XerC [compost metagenome]
MSYERTDSAEAVTIYRRKEIIKNARIQHLVEAEASYLHTPRLEAFIQFQLMTGARRSETMSLTWNNIDFGQQTAFIPESKNGRPRKLALRKDVIVLLQQLPRNGDTVFQISVDALRKAWARICKVAGLTNDDELHVHDLRHEAISRVADVGGNLPGGFSLIDLQAFSGHRDTRMLLRYTHLCMPSLAKRLDEAFADRTQTVVHRGQRRLKKGAQLNIKDLANVQPMQSVPVSVSETRPCNVLPFRPRAAA